MYSYTNTIPSLHRNYDKLSTQHGCSYHPVRDFDVTKMFEKNKYYLKISQRCAKI
jgi:hypothetical protein